MNAVRRTWHWMRLRHMRVSPGIISQDCFGSLRAQPFLTIWIRNELPRLKNISPIRLSRSQLLQCPAAFPACPPSSGCSKFWKDAHLQSFEKCTARPAGIWNHGDLDWFSHMQRSPFSSWDPEMSLSARSLHKKRFQKATCFLESDIVQKMGLEPTWPKRSQAPEACASANSATSADMNFATHELHLTKLLRICQSLL